MDTYVIGGFVRDKILHRPCQDIDIVTVGDGIILAQAVALEFGIKKDVNIFQRFGTAMIKYEEFEIEFVGARKESYTPESRKPTVQDGTLEDDQNRRDFTINALAVSINNESFGEFLDPFGGIDHIKAKLLKTPLDPDITFSDDPLRMMRAIRFATQLNFEIDPETFDAIKRNKKRIEIISTERITTELNKILACPTPSVGFKLLFDSGLLEYIFPEMAALQGIETKDGKAHKDNFYHTIEVVDNICKETNDLWLRWAAVLHDIAKPPTKRFDKKSGWTFHGHEVLGAKWVPRIFKRMKLPLDHKMKYVQKLVRLHLRPISLTKENITDSAIRRLLYDAGQEIDDLMILCKADITSKNYNKVRRYKDNYILVQEKLLMVEEKDRIRNWQPPISGELIMETFGIPPGRVIGKLKSAITEAILDGKIANNYEEAYAFMIEKAVEFDLSPK
jgi:tRNA nucleotidyltransferase/poly(A) polymerase